MPALTRYEGLSLRRLTHGGYLVTHPDIYTEQSLYMAATTIDEVFTFMRTVLEKPPEPPPETEDR
jgi:hypothetical protein